MPLSQSGYPEIPKSITNPDVDIKHALDVDSPLSFLSFIKTINTSFNPTNLQEYYSAYLKNWNLLDSGKKEDENNIIIQRYREFIQDINLNYTTLEEQKFLQSLDFNDPLDLEIAVPFYSKKLIEISKYYNKKREDTKFQITKSQIKGTNFGVVKELKDLTLNNLENLTNSKILYDFSQIKDNIEVEIEELYESYPKYFNQSPDDTIYDNKDLDYGEDIFLKSNQELVEKIFGGLNDDLKKLKEVDQLFDNKRELTKKYIGSDFYYLSTGSTVYDYVSGRIFEADRPIDNFLNIQNPTTASTNRKQFLDQYEIGFFKPHKTSIIIIDGENYSFSPNFENLKPNTIYYFPDPSIRGTNGDVLTFVTNDLNNKRNDSSGNAKNQPTTDKKDSQYYGYISNFELPHSKYLDSVFNTGYIQDSKSDIYNNLYGLFKKDGNFTRKITNDKEDVIPYDILTGHTFYDYLYGEGYSFDYTTTDTSTIPYTTRSGLSTFTASFSADMSSALNINGGKFIQKDFYYPPDFLPTFQIIDGVFISDTENPYPDTISSDLSAYPNGGEFYYSRLIEGGVHTTSPLQRALLDPSYPSLTANASKNVFYDGLSTFLIDANKITTIYEDPVFEVSSIYYDPTVLNTSVYTLSSEEYTNYFERLDTRGSLYVRNASTKKVKKIEEEFQHFSSIFSQSVYNEILSAVNNFEIVNDVLFIETDNNFIITKILYENGVPTNPKKTSYVIPHSTTPFHKISKRYKIGNKVYFSIIETEVYPLSSNNFKIYPKIYEFDTEKYAQKVHSPNNTSSDFYMISGGDITYSKAENPVFTYCGRSNLYNISFLLKDSSNNFCLEEFDFKLNPLEMIYHTEYKQK